MKNIVLGIIFIFLISGCGATSTKSLRADAEFKETINMDLDYQEAYRRIASTLPSCMPSAPINTPMNLYADIKRGEISAIGEWGVYLLIEVQHTGEKSSQVDVYAENSSWARYIGKVKSWLDGTSKEC